MATSLKGAKRTNIGQYKLYVDTRTLAAESAVTFLTGLHSIENVQLTAESAPAMTWTQTDSADGNASVVAAGLAPNRKVSVAVVGR